ncbi:MAG: archaetidylserine decarboxylase [Candidatus Cloacimonetes bacterium]|nr:archaetidylserine decarboxylase [Candidatus Cloacimonadota bacterium]
MKKFYYKKRNIDDLFEEKVIGSRLIFFLYSSFLGKSVLKVLTKNCVISHLYGKFMNTKLSRGLIKCFINKNAINIDESKKSLSDFNNFNDFFTRELKSLSRNIDTSSDSIISPADGKILVYENFEAVAVKGTMFDLDKLIFDKPLTQIYQKCSIAVIRLAPTDYHRFHFPIDGYVSETKTINGHYFSVSPIALHFNPKIFFENKRTICEIKHDDSFSFLYMEIGATLVGSIKQTYRADSYIKKGDEKGYFEFGGSTVVMIFKNHNIMFDSDLIENSKNNYETKIFMGDKIGVITK